MARWVKNLIAVAQVAAEAWLQSLAQCSGSSIATDVRQVATAAQVQFLALEHPYATGSAIKKKKKNLAPEVKATAFRMKPGLMLFITDGFLLLWASASQTLKWALLFPFCS